MVEKNRKKSFRRASAIFLLFLFSSLARGSQDSTLVKSHKISIELFPEKQAFSARDELTVRHRSPQVSFYLNKNFMIDEVLVERKKASFQIVEIQEQAGPQRAADEQRPSDLSRAERLVIDARSPGEHRISIRYRGVVFEEPQASQFSRDYIASQTAGQIGERGTFLAPESFWYPQGNDELSEFEVWTTSPLGYETITQGEKLLQDEKSGKLVIHWKNEHPSDGLYLQAGPYEVEEDEVEGIKVYTYFFKGGKELARKYLEKSKQYLALYNGLLGRYPYLKFAVVENFFETGYGMPSWTLLGSTVLRLPFIPDTSLPHEICHNWWGNGVFVDYFQGNWCEGLTVYCADYWLKKKAEPEGDVDYRRQINRDYASYVKTNDGFPLLEFRSRHDPATRAVGYGKAMMVFHDLQRMMGEEVFFGVLRRLMSEFKLKRASWKDVLGVFEKEGGLKLDQFYKQWIERPGAPVLHLGEVKADKQGETYTLFLKINQEREPYELDVPVRITTERYVMTQRFKVKKSREEFQVEIKARPIRLEVDPEHHLFRRLYPEEIPPSIAKVFGSKKQLIILGGAENPETRDKLRAAAEMINRTKTAEIKLDFEVSAEELQPLPVIMIGELSDNTAAEEFLSSVEREVPWEKSEAEREDAGSVVVFKHPQNPEHAVMVISVGRTGDILSIVRKLPHYGRYSYLLFQGENNVAKGIWEIRSSPLIHVFD